MAGPRKPTPRLSSGRSRSRNNSRGRAGASTRNVARSVPRSKVKIRHSRPSPSEIERQRIDTEYQAAVRNYDSAVRAFQRQNYQRALEIFEKLADSESAEVADRARVYVRLCQQKAGRSRTVPKTPEEHYTLGVAALNARELDDAIEHLNKADKLRPNRDHIQYALAAAHSLQGNVGAALDHLQIAVKLRPENRFHARRDEDFRRLTTDPRFRRLVYSAAARPTA